MTMHAINATAQSALSPVERLQMLHAARQDHRISRLSVLLLLILDGYYNTERGIAWPSQMTLAAELASNRTQVTRSLRELVEAGYVQLGWRNRGRTYALLLPAPPRVTGPVHLDDRRVTGPVHVNGPAGPRVTGPVHLDVTHPVHRTHTTGTHTPGTPDNSKSPESNERAQTTSASRPKATRQRSEQQTRLPKAWEPSEQMVAHCITDLGMSEQAVRDETRDFKLYHLGKGGYQLDWTTTYYRWMNLAKPGGKYERRAGGSSFKPFIAPSMGRMMKSDTPGFGIR